MKGNSKKTGIGFGFVPEDANNYAGLNLSMPRHNLEDYEPGASRTQVLHALDKVAKAKSAQKHTVPHVQA